MRFKTIKDLCTVTKGITGISKAIEGEYPLVVTSEERKSHNEFQFDTNAVIVPLVSSTGHGHASMKRIHYQEGKFAVGSILCAIVPKDDTILSSEFLYHYLNLNKERELVSRMKGMANVTLSIKEIEKIPIPILTIQEQQNFVEYYSDIENHSNDISTEITQQLELIKNLRQAFLREAMQGVLVSNETSDNITGTDLFAEIQAKKAQLVEEKKIKKPKPLAPVSEEGIPFDIPVNWSFIKLNEICSLITCGYASTPKYVSEGGVFISAKNVKPFNFKYSDEKKISFELFNKLRLNVKPERNDLLITRVGAGIGETAMIDSDEEFAIYVSLTLVKTICVINKFYLYYFNSPMGLKNAVEYTTGKKSSQGNLNVENVRDFIVPLPPLEIQERIVAKLDELMSYCDALEEQIKQSKQTNELLLQQVLREALGDKKEKAINKEIGVSINKYIEVETDYDKLVAETFGEYLPKKGNNINDTNKELASLVYLMNNGLGTNYGNVAFQKAVFNSSFITPNLYSKKHDFINHNYGTFSKELANDLTHNPYLKTKKVNGFEVYEIEPSKKNEIINILSSSENKNFVSSINRLINLYRLPFINKETNKMELLNTILKIYSDLKTIDIEIIYQAMKDWKIKQTGFNTKAEKFSKEDTAMMIELLVRNNVL